MRWGKMRVIIEKAFTAIWNIMTAVLGFMILLLALVAVMVLLVIEAPLWIVAGAIDLIDNT